MNDLSTSMSFKDALERLENMRVKSTRPLIPPQILQEDLPLYVSHHYKSRSSLTYDVRTLNAAQTVLEGRFAIEKILHGDDDRLMVVVGYENIPFGVKFYISSIGADPVRSTMSPPPWSTRGS